MDIGNTRAKWAVLRGERLSAPRALAHQPGRVDFKALVRSAPRDVERVVAVSVMGRKFERALAAAARSRFGVRAEFVRSSRQAAGVRNGYREVWRLGADRWVGVIAAHALAGSRPALAVSIGTALTVDAVTADGRHLGGAIAPGPDTMVWSLKSGTQGIRRRANGSRAAGSRSRGLFAADTANALDAGAAYAAAAFIDRARTEARAVFGAQPVLLLSGGAARALRPYIKSPFKLVPDLVLRGLAVLARS